MENARLQACRFFLNLPFQRTLGLSRNLEFRQLLPSLNIDHINGTVFCEEQLLAIGRGLSPIETDPKAIEITNEDVVKINDQCERFNHMFQYEDGRVSVAGGLICDKFRDDVMQMFGNEFRRDEIRITSVDRVTLSNDSWIRDLKSTSNISYATDYVCFSLTRPNRTNGAVKLYYAIPRFGQPFVPFVQHLEQCDDGSYVLSRFVYSSQDDTAYFGFGKSNEDVRFSSNRYVVDHTPYMTGDIQHSRPPRCYFFCCADNEIQTTYQFKVRSLRSVQNPNYPRNLLDEDKEFATQLIYDNGVMVAGVHNKYPSNYKPRIYSNVFVDRDQKTRSYTTLFSRNTGDVSARCHLNKTNDKALCASGTIVFYNEDGRKITLLSNGFLHKNIYGRTKQLDINAFIKIADNAMNNNNNSTDVRTTNRLIFHSAEGDVVAEHYGVFGWDLNERTSQSCMDLDVETLSTCIDGLKISYDDDMSTWTLADTNNTILGIYNTLESARLDPRISDYVNNHQHLSVRDETDSMCDYQTQMTRYNDDGSISQRFLSEACYLAIHEPSNYETGLLTLYQNNSVVCVLSNGFAKSESNDYLYLHPKVEEEMDDESDYEYERVDSINRLIIKDANGVVYEEYYGGLDENRFDAFNTQDDERNKHIDCLKLDVEKLKQVVIGYRIVFCKIKHKWIVTTTSGENPHAYSTIHRAREDTRITPFLSDYPHLLMPRDKIRIYDDRPNSPIVNVKKPIDIVVAPKTEKRSSVKRKRPS